MNSVWAVASNTIKQVLRMKIAAVFIILLIVLLPVMSLTMTGDGTLKGRLQSFVSYGLSLTGFLLCLLTIVATVYSLTSEIKQKQIHTVLTKPVRRFQLLLGKLLGVVLLDIVLLILFSALIYVITIYIPKFSGASEDEIAKVQNEFYTARASLKPPKVDVTRDVLETYKRLERTGQLEQLFQGLSRKRINAMLTRQKQLEKRAVELGHDLLWEFNNVKPVDPNQSLFIRFKYDVSVNPPDLQVYGRWIVGDYRQVRFGTEVETPIYTFQRKDLIRTFHEIEVPADAVAEDGYLAVGFLNDPQRNNTVVIFPPDGLEVLYKADSFTANFIRAASLILFHLFFLACLAILASTFLSFPVAILLCLAVFFTATISGFCLESFSFLSENISSVYFYTLRPIIRFLPQFDKFKPAKFLISARFLSWTTWTRVLGLMVCVKALLLWLLALLVFSYREIAKVII